MTGYTEVFVAPVPKNNIPDYRKHADLFTRVWREHGALSVIEVEAEDVKPGKVTSFPQSVGLKPEETVFVGIATYKSREHRDDVNAKAMKDPRMSGMDPKSMPFDAKRMFWGGFKPFAGTSTSTSVVQPYLFFRGRCEEAIEYYKAKLGAEVTMLLRFKDNPGMPGEDKVPAALDNKIMHAEVRIHGADLMLSDGMRTGPLDFDCMSLSLSLQDEAEADRVFDALAADGKVQMPMSKTFFAKRFGAVSDKFGVSWMIGVHEAR